MDAITVDNFRNSRSAWDSPTAVLLRELRHVTAEAQQKRAGSNCATRGSAREKHDRCLRGFINKPYPESMQCNVSNKLMSDPVRAEDQIVYDRPSIQYWFDQGMNTSPITGKEIGTTLVSEASLKSNVEHWIGENISVLHHACSSGDVEEVKRLVQTGLSAAEINLKDLDRTSPLQYALRFNHNAIVSILRACENCVDVGPRILYYSHQQTANVFEKEWILLKKKLRTVQKTEKNHGGRTTGCERQQYDRSIGGFMQRYPEQFQCLLSYCIFEDPVVAEDGYTYSRAKIEQWVDTFDISPITNEKIGRTFVPNLNLQSEIEEWIVKDGGAFHKVCSNGELDKVETFIQDMDAGKILIIYYNITVVFFVVVVLTLFHLNISFK